MRRDHVVPLVRFRGARFSFGGRNGCVNPENHNLDNIVPACDGCNTSKGSMDLETWRGSLRWFGWNTEGVTFYFEKCNDAPASRKAAGNPNTRQRSNG